jgi:hypothetical protein
MVIGKHWNTNWGEHYIRIGLLIIENDQGTEPRSVEGVVVRLDHPSSWPHRGECGGLFSS